MLRARLLGELTVWVDGRCVPPIAPSRPRSLLAYLLLHPGMHSRSALASRFWPGYLDTSARASLRSALWSVRAALDAAGGGHHLRTERTRLGIPAGPDVLVDVVEFARLVAVGDEESLEVALRTGREPLLADLADAWACDAREAHRLGLAAVCARLATLAEERGDVAAAVRWSREGLEHDRLDETAHRALMRRLDATGDRAAALAAFDRARAVLAAELGVAPSRATRELAERLRADGAHGAAATGDPSAPSAPATRPPLVGRARESEFLWRCTRAAARGRGRVVVITGPAGVGKTRLAEELVSRVRADGPGVARGTPLDLPETPPLVPWADLVRELVALRPPPPDVVWARDLARLSPASNLTAIAPLPVVGTPELDRLRLFQGVRALVEWVAAAGGLLLVLEDMHRADASSLAMLAHVGRHLDGLPCTVLVTRRATPADSPLDAALREIRRQGVPVTDVALGPLAAEPLRALVVRFAPGLPAAAVDEIVRMAGGNPLLALQAARAARDGRPATAGLQQAVRARMGDLGSAARDVVDTVAVAGRPLGLGELGAAGAAEGLLAAVQQGVSAGLLHMPDPRSVDVAHDLLRDALMQVTSAARRADAHRRLAAGLAGRPERVNAEIAHHLGEAGDLPAARRFLIAAADDARTVGALDDAAALLRRALSAGDADAPDIWLSLADVCAWRGDRAGMDDAVARAVEIMEGTGDRVGIVTALAFRSRWLHTTLCFPAESLQAARRALRAADATAAATPEARLIALAGAAWAEAVAGDPEHVEGLIAAGRRILEGMGDRALEAEFEHARGTALVRSGRFGDGAEVCARAGELARLAHRPDVAALAMLMAASALACAGRIAQVLRLLDRAASWPFPGRSLDLQLRAARAYALARLGDAAAAEAVATATLDTARRTDHHHDRAVAAFDLGTILLGHGRHRDAAAHLLDALSAPAAGVPRALARLRLAEALVRGGDGDGAERALGEVPFEPVRAADMPETLVARLCHIQGLVAASRGDAALADRRFGEAERLWRSLASPSGDAYAAVLVDLGRPPVAGLVDVDEHLRRLARDRAEHRTPHDGR